MEFQVNQRETGAQFHECVAGEASARSFVLSLLKLFSQEVRHSLRCRDRGFSIVSFFCGTRTHVERNRLPEIEVIAA